MFASDVMKAPVKSIHPDATIGEAIALLLSERVPACR